MDIECSMTQKEDTNTDLFNARRWEHTYMYSSQPVQPAAVIHDGQMTIYARARVLCTDTEHSPAKLTQHRPITGPDDPSSASSRLSCPVNPPDLRVGTHVLTVFAVAPRW